jgi:hypothetical protein
VWDQCSKWDPPWEARGRSLVQTVHSLPLHHLISLPLTLHKTQGERLWPIILFYTLHTVLNAASIWLGPCCLALKRL